MAIISRPAISSLIYSSQVAALHVTVNAPVGNVQSIYIGKLCHLTIAQKMKDNFNVQGFDIC